MTTFFSGDQCIPSVEEEGITALTSEVKFVMTLLQMDSTISFAGSVLSSRSLEAYTYTFYDMEDQIRMG